MSRLAFFRQSGWMVLASFLGGVFMTAVHITAAKDFSSIQLGPLSDLLSRWRPLDKGEYGLFYTLLLVLGYIGIPAAGVQTIIAQQTAMTMTGSQERELRGVIRVVLGGTFVIWIIAALVIFLFRVQLLSELKISDPNALAITLLCGLVMLWSPVFAGVLQGRQDFLWLGWVGILSGLGRCVAIFFIVRMLGAGVTGAMAAVLAGALFTFLIAALRTRAVWLGAVAAFPWKPWLQRVAPLTLGIGATTLLMTADMVLVRSVFNSDQTGFYSAAGVLGRALAYFTGPMAAVMFPKIVQSAARAERTDVLAQAMGATALLGGAGALFCTLFPSLPLRIMYDPTYLVIAPLVPWFAWCVLPLTLANVLINNLLARSRFGVVPWLLLLAVCYTAVLVYLSSSLSVTSELAAFKTIVRALGSFGLLTMLVAAWFTWRTTEHSASLRAR